MDLPNSRKLTHLIWKFSKAWDLIQQRDFNILIRTDSTFEIWKVHRCIMIKRFEYLKAIFQIFDYFASTHKLFVTNLRATSFLEVFPRNKNSYYDFSNNKIINKAIMKLPIIEHKMSYIFFLNSNQMHLGVSDDLTCSKMNSDIP